MFILVALILPLASANTVDQRQDCPLIVYQNCYDSAAINPDMQCVGGYDSAG